MRSILAATIFACSALAAQAAPQIAAQLQPDRIAVGESARLVVTLSGTSANVRPDVPQVEGLRIQPSGQSSQIRIVNGQTSSTTGFTYRVTPERAGEFEIPAIKAQNLETEPLELHVSAGASRQRRSRSPRLGRAELPTTTVRLRVPAPTGSPSSKSNVPTMVTVRISTSASSRRSPSAPSSARGCRLASCQSRCSRAAHSLSTS